MTKLWGVDVSVHNQKIDWNKAKKAGIDFAIVRLGWSGYDGRIRANNAVDKRFHENMKGAIAAGIPVGVYVFSYTRTPDGARIAAKETIEIIKPYKVEYPVIFDMEVEGTDYANYTKATNTAIAKAYLDEVQKAGYYSMFYTYKSFAENKVNMNELAVYDTWIAQIAPQLTYKGDVGMWQYSWGGKIAGIPTKVDMNYAYKDYKTIITNAGLNGLKPPVEPEKPPVEPEKPDTGLETVDYLKAQIEELSETIELMDEVIDKLRQEVAEKDKEILELRRDRKEIAELMQEAYGDFHFFQESFLKMAEKYK